MTVTWFERAIALAWWICAIIVGPIAVVGFFAGGWLILGVLWAWWGNMDVKNPFKRSTDAWQDEYRTGDRMQARPDELRQDEHSD